MINAENGQVLIKGNEREISVEYSAITGRMLQDILSTDRFYGGLGKHLSPESRAAACLVANLEAALINHTKLNKKEFLDAMARIVNYARGEDNE